MNEYWTLLETYCKGKPKYSEIDLCYCYFVHHNSPIDWSGASVFKVEWYKIYGEFVYTLTYSQKKKELLFS